MLWVEDPAEICPSGVCVLEVSLQFLRLPWWASQCPQDSSQPGSGCQLAGRAARTHGDTGEARGGGAGPSGPRRCRKDVLGLCVNSGRRGWGGAVTGARTGPHCPEVELRACSFSCEGSCSLKREPPWGRRTSLHAPPSPPPPLRCGGSAGQAPCQHPADWGWARVGRACGFPRAQLSRIQQWPCQRVSRDLPGLSWLAEGHLGSCGGVGVPSDPGKLKAGVGRGGLGPARPGVSSEAESRTKVHQPVEGVSFYLAGAAAQRAPPGPRCCVTSWVRRQEAPSAGGPSPARGRRCLPAAAPLLPELPRTGTSHRSAPKLLAFLWFRGVALSVTWRLLRVSQALSRHCLSLQKRFHSHRGVSFVPPAPGHRLNRDTGPQALLLPVLCAGKSFFFPYEGHTFGIWRFPGEGLNWSRSCRPTPPFTATPDP
ncbi:uncharacterized protein LOC110255907 [Sus scrofa]|uniref:uncharacterized protein LOC110255907 n=1 Tax=Sus scrofa TaxID=9823 RepID=UPI000A2AF529|nr:uncharacterized protein LOC110255907 [Sus scrofa]